MIKISRNEFFKKTFEMGYIAVNKKYDIAPLDLSKYPLTEKTKRIVDSNFMEESEDYNGEYMLKSHWPSNLSYSFAKECEFCLKLIDYYSAYAFSDDQLAIFTYCEGDVTLTLFTDKEKYKKEKDRTIAFYNREG